VPNCVSLSQAEALASAEALGTDDWRHVIGRIPDVPYEVPIKDVFAIVLVSLPSPAVSVTQRALSVTQRARSVTQRALSVTPSCLRHPVASATAVATALAADTASHHLTLRHCCLRWPVAAETLTASFQQRGWGVQRSVALFKAARAWVRPPRRRTKSQSCFKKLKHVTGWRAADRRQAV
jgi:hypothetical protein